MQYIIFDQERLCGGALNPSESNELDALILFDQEKLCGGALYPSESNALCILIRLWDSIGIWSRDFCRFTVVDDYDYDYRKK